MDIRRVQRSGNMYYVYLPTSWCRKLKIAPNANLCISENSDHSLSISTTARETKPKVVNLTLPSEYDDILINLIIACYVNPLHSFRIETEKTADLNHLLSQKSVISGLEFVELDGETITYEASMTINKPDSLLKTMFKKTRNLLTIMIHNYDKVLINKFEDEIDKSKILIQKSVIGALLLNTPMNLKYIEMYYIAQIAVDLERLVDYMIRLDKREKKFLNDCLLLVESLKDLIENIPNLDYLKAASFTKNVIQMKGYKSDSLKNFDKQKIKKHFQNIAELILDWSISKKIED